MKYHAASGEREARRFRSHAQKQQPPVVTRFPDWRTIGKTMDKIVSKGPGREMSTTMGFVRLLSDLLRDKNDRQVHRAHRSR